MSARSTEQGNNDLQDCLCGLISAQAATRGDALAILAPGRRPLTYRALRLQVEETVKAMAALGIGGRDRVATVLPDGPETAVVSIAVAAGATCAPLNPAYRESELDYYLADLDAKAVIVPAGSKSAAAAVARSRGIMVLEIGADKDAEAGVFTLSGEGRGATVGNRFAGPDDIALALHTSGSAARPKLVPLTHRNICVAARNIREAVRLTENDRSLVVMPLFHIHGLSVLFASLAAGASVVCTPGFSEERFFEWLEEFRPTWYSAAPPIHRAVLDIARRYPDVAARAELRFIRSASAAMPRQVMEQMEEAFRAPFIEAYGMTEAAPQIASNRAAPDERKIGSVGRAAGPDIAIMDEDGRVIPAGVTGEIVIRGANVIEGYASDCDVNHDAFVDGWLRTGDMGRFDKDGFLFVTGRVKEIINRGGEKISPREVDEVLMSHPAVVEAVSFAVPHEVLGENVAAAVVLKSSWPDAAGGDGHHRVIEDIRDFAAARLAYFKVPQDIAVVDDIPKGPTGKPLRIGLAEKLNLTAAGREAFSRREAAAPRSPTERKLADIWTEVLGIEAPGIHDNFFHLGGHSLAASRVAARVVDGFHVEVSMQSLFERPTIAGLAQLVDERAGGRKHGEDAKQDGAYPAKAVGAIERSGGRGPFALSFAQQRLWFLDRMESGSAYNMSAPLRIVGVLDEGALAASLDEIRRRHDTLRTTFQMVDGEAVQVVADFKPVELPVVDLGGMREPQGEAEALRMAAEEAARPFNLAVGPLFRAVLLRLGPEYHALLLTIHHIVCDGWSTGVLYRELAALYGGFAAGRGVSLPELPVQYTDFAAWQREWLSGGALDREIAYWKRVFPTAPAVIELPADRPRGASRTHKGARRQTLVARDVTGKLEALSRREGATLFMTVLAAFKTLLLRYTGQGDVAVGIPIANRPRLETEGLIGFFANTLLLRTDLSGDPLFSELLRRVSATARGAYAHQNLPFEMLVEQLHPEREPGRVPLVQVMFAFQNLPETLQAAGGEVQALWGGEVMSGPPFELAPGVTARPFKADSGGAKFEVTLYVFKTPDGLALTWQYDADLFDAATIDRLAAHFGTLLAGIAGDSDRHLSELPVMSDAERRLLEVEWNKTGKSYEEGCCFHRLFERQAQLTPDAVAVECSGKSLSYAQLNSEANKLARHLRRRGVKPGALAAIALARGEEMAVAVLGVLKAGGAYAPLDPEYPPDRLAFMLEDSGAAVLVTRQDLSCGGDVSLATMLHVTSRGRAGGKGSGHAAPELVCLDGDWTAIAEESDDNIDGTVAPSDLAYVIYTSGSTGRPKGVEVTHGNLAHYVQAMRDAVGIEGSDRCLHTASFAFSSSVRQLAVPLSSGATVIVATADDIRDPKALFELIRACRVSVIDIVPSYWRMSVQVLESLGHSARADLLDNDLRLILSASEPLPADLPEKWTVGFGHEARIVNMFGQTETTGIVMTYPIPPSGAGREGIVPIGRPIANTRAYVLDASMRLAPVGARGELYIGGAGVAKGYLGHPEHSRERFVADPSSGVPGARLYRTGDIARYRPDGVVEFIGRADDQIKVRGFRIEPGEIEAVLRRHPQIADAVVVADAQRLAAFVVPGTACDAPVRLTMELRDFAKHTLPEYMVPSAFITLDAMPVTPTGKLDRKSLSTRLGRIESQREAQNEREKSVRRFVAPRTPVENALTQVWQDVLGVDRVGVDDNFFDLGGNSLLSVQIVLRAKQAGIEVSLAELFRHQTVAGLARVARVYLEAPAESEPAADAAPNAEPAVFTDAEAPVIVNVERLRAFGREALEKAGLAAEVAGVVTEVQLESSLRGQPTHNMGDIPRYARRVAAGIINAHPEFRVEHETAVSVRADADNGPGQWAAVLGMETAIGKARKAGVGMVTVRRSNHFGAAGHYAWMAAREGLIGLCTTNGPLVLAPTGGVTPTFGNDPLGVGIPAGRRCPIVLDIAMSVAPRGRIGVHLAEGRPLPPGWILDRFGRPSTNLADLAAGLGAPIGGHKGYGLAMIMEVLAGVMSGAGFCGDHRRENLHRPGEGSDLGHFFMAIDPELFMPIAEFTARVEAMIDQTKSGEPAPGAGEILIPGEMEMRARARSIEEGVPMRPFTYRALLEYGEKEGLTARLR